MSDDGDIAFTADAARLVKRSVTIAGHRTSVSVEAAFWAALKDIARRRGRSVAALVEDIDAARVGNLSSALRLFVLQELMRRAERGGGDD